MCLISTDLTANFFSWKTGHFPLCLIFFLLFIRNLFILLHRRQVFRSPRLFGTASGRFGGRRFGRCVPHAPVHTPKMYVIIISGVLTVLFRGHGLQGVSELTDNILRKIHIEK